jgi:hypothetical protein
MPRGRRCHPPEAPIDPGYSFFYTSLSIAVIDFFRVFRPFHSLSFFDLIEYHECMFAGEAQPSRLFPQAGALW